MREEPGILPSRRLQSTLALVAVAAIASVFGTVSGVVAFYIAKKAGGDMTRPPFRHIGTIRRIEPMEPDYLFTACTASALRWLAGISAATAIVTALAVFWIATPY